MHAFELSTITLTEIGQWNVSSLNIKTHLQVLSVQSVGGGPQAIFLARQNKQASFFVVFMIFAFVFV